MKHLERLLQLDAEPLSIHNMDHLERLLEAQSFSVQKLYYMKALVHLLLHNADYNAVTEQALYTLLHSLYDGMGELITLYDNVTKAEALSRAAL